MRCVVILIVLLFLFLFEFVFIVCLSVCNVHFVYEKEENIQKIIESICAVVWIQFVKCMIQFN